MSLNLIWSTCHSATSPGVSTPGGITERMFNRQVLAGVKEYACQDPSCELFDLIDMSPMNWKRANALFNDLDGPGVLVELHMNSNGAMSLGRTRAGCLAQYHRDHQATCVLAADLLDSCAAIVPPHSKIAAIQQPGNDLYPRAAMFHSVSGPCVLLEAGFIQDPAFCAWTEQPGAPAELGRVLAGAIYGWFKDQPTKIERV